MAGEAVAAFALTEPEVGSDVASLALAAEPDGTGWRLTGVKKWISNAPEADFYTVFARTTAGAGARGLTAFVVEADAKGVSGRSLSLLAPHAIGTLELDGVLVPQENVLGDVDGGFKVAMATLNVFRPSVGAGAVGMAQAALDAAVAYTSEREAFGRRLQDFQGVSHQLADAAARLEAARALVAKAAAAYDEGADDVPKLSAMAKLVATESFSRSWTPRSRSTARLGSKPGTCSSVSTATFARCVSTRAPLRSNGRSSRGASIRPNAPPTSARASP